MRAHLAYGVLAMIFSAACHTSHEVDAGPPAPWSPASIAWVGYDEGLREAHETGKPMCLVFFTTWCPHCANYARVFNDPRVIETAQNFVMVRLDSDKNKELSARYALDGEYIPRTYFVDGEGRPLDVRAHPDRFQYFYNEHDPAALLAGMQAASAQRH
jgi:thioredoxin-related protein